MVVNFKTWEYVFATGKVGALATLGNAAYAGMKVEHGHARGSKGVAHTKTDATTRTACVVNKRGTAIFGQANGVVWTAIRSEEHT